MKAEVVRGHLEYSDERGSYRIPLGRRGRKCLTVLDRKEGEYTRSLELDLFTGFVYYCVDNATSGGLSYYYDMSSKKVGHYFIHRYLRNARNHGFAASPEETEIFEKLPCDNWVEEMEKLPGWKEAIENRMENLLLPGRDPVRIPMGKKGVEAAGPEESRSQQAEADLANLAPALTAVSFLVSPSSHQAGTRERVFTFEKGEAEDMRILRSRNDAFGEEFFGENGEYDLFLTEREYRWICGLAGALRDAGPAADKDKDKDKDKKEPGHPDRFYGGETADQLSGLLKDQEQERMVLRETVLRFADGDKQRIPVRDPAQEKRAQELRTILYGLLRREVELY